MATLPVIRQALADAAAQALDVKAYPTVSQAANPPCVVVQTHDPVATYEMLHGKFLRAHYHLGVVLLGGGARSNPQQVEDRLGEWLDPDGPLIEALTRLSTGSCVVVSASQMRVYPAGDNEYLGAEITVEVDP